jgi:hypothetical protein
MYLLKILGKRLARIKFIARLELYVKLEPRVER